MKRAQRVSRSGPESEKRNTVIAVRFSVEELAVIDAAAERTSERRSDLIREAALAAAALAARAHKKKKS